ncbi:NACHT domain-containing protein [Trichoderma simmonsii]|uniref:NACHT domain-containing protein n=1 Tax=Trichoderma simmonsii TaxID=1491479 RepID=A0A8G0PJK3_9HYPO|nr:NACHT domain-containing protein [Trichoderma simmonsii]
MENYSISSNSFKNNVQFHQGNNYYASETPQSKSDACRNVLFLADPIVDRESLKSTKGRRTVGTCEWIRDNETYQSWLDGGVQCLWITGGPGKGKTMLSIFLTEELEKRTQESKATEFLVFFFCTPDEKHSSAVSILRGLAYQLIRFRPNLASHILSDFESAQKTQETLNSPNALWMVLEKLLQAPDLGTVFCVLDGLDECDEESSSLLIDKFYEYFFESSRPSGVQFKLAIVSRKIDLLDAFPQVKLDPDNNEYVNSDIQNFISSSLKRLERIRGFNDYRESIETTLLDRAQGTFLWVGFVIAELSRQRTCTQIMETLEGIPQGLHGLYSRMLAQIEASRRSVVFDILQCITVAVRPLTLSELGEVIHFPSTMKISKGQAILDYITLCGHILTVHDQQVSLVHQSARDYLLQGDADRDPILKEFQINAEHAHATLAESCLDYIEKSDLRNTPLDRKDASVLQKSPLLEYAARYWPEHASWCSGANNKSSFSLSRPFFQETSSVRKNWWRTYGKRSTDGRLQDVSNLPLLHMASYFGIYGLARELLITGTSLRTREVINKSLGHDNETTPLSLAARRGHTAIIQLLLTNGADGKNKALKLAAHRGHIDIIQLLLANGAGDKDKALRAAAGQGNVTIVQLLLANGADGKDKALREAAVRGHINIVQLLLANGADGKGVALYQTTFMGHAAIVQLLLTNGADGKDEALQVAAYRGHMDILQLLLANGANGKDRALQQAAYGGHIDIVQLLLTNGADGKDEALQVAAYRGHMDILQLLLANGADGKDKALQQAAHGGHIDIVQLLLSNGADGKDEALREAVYEGHTAIEQLLVANGADGFQF